MASNFWRAWWAWLICFVFTIVISLFTKKKPEAELVGLVKGLTPAAAADGILWYRKPETFAVLAVIILIILNIYFW
jgi:SSS family solute:Na+ symporter